MSVRFSICFFQMPERRDRFESRSSSARAKGDRHPFEWSNSQPASAAMSSKMRAFAPIFAASLGVLGRRLSRMLGLIAQPKGQPFSEKKNDRSRANNPYREWSDDLDRAHARSALGQFRDLGPARLAS